MRLPNCHSAITIDFPSYFVVKEKHSKFFTKGLKILFKVNDIQTEKNLTAKDLTETLIILRKRTSFHQLFLYHDLRKIIVGRRTDSFAFEFCESSNGSYSF